MSLNWAGAMPVHGCVGGLMIGVAAAVMLVAEGRIAGVSGLLARMAGLGGSAAPVPVAAAFVAGLPAGGWLWELASGHAALSLPALPYLAVGGILVGFGTRLGSGCTSGHGVCGLSRLSARSIAATATFMAAGVVTVAVMNLAGVRP